MQSRKGRIESIQNDEVLEVLEKLGLSKLQAKIYLTLVCLGEAEVQEISKRSNIARQDIYRIIPALEELGLAEEIVATPKQYKAIPLDEGTLSLYQKRIDEDAQLKNSVQSLIEIPYKPISNTGEGNKSNFIITTDHKRVDANLEKAYAEASSIDIILPGRNALDFMVSHLYDSLLTAVSKGAKVRILSKKTELHSKTKNFLLNLVDNGNFKLKFVDSDFDFCMAIINKKELNISISEKGVPSLWTNNCQLLHMGQLMFENQWNTQLSSELPQEAPSTQKSVAQVKIVSKRMRIESNT